ncbi:hypothetical protein [Thermococcus sp. 21S9]|uniref:hypothetical protein n=1 Tax=Thermococcus sp. 21S9 TaxID=1638223 RepID=UPI00143A272A|nr:hypothetical protein [Thermococcus sp. 21S9]NJE54729.1 hypothetical protein [Thermococcus sp. 21S9]
MLPTANPVEIQEKYSGGGFGPDAHYGEEDLPIHEIARLNILGKLASTILAYKYGVPLEDAAELVEREIIIPTMVLKGKLPHELTPKEIEEIARNRVKKFNIPENHAGKIAELIWILAQATKEAIPEIDEKTEIEILEDLDIGHKHGTLERASSLHNIKVHFGLDESAFDKYAPEITRIAEELEQISPFKEKRSDRSNPIALSQAKLEVLSIIRGLEFAGFSEEARERALEVLSSKIEELIEGPVTAETVWKLGLYAFAVEMIKRGDFERLREVEGL